MGDPNGIGPEIILRSLRSPTIKKAAHYVIMGSSDVFDRTAKGLEIPISYHTVSDITHGKHPLTLLSIGNYGLRLLRKKGPTQEGGELSFRCIVKGIDLALNGGIDALVTAPICKEAIHLAGYDYPGHTEILCDLTNAKRVVMLMVGGKLRVAFTTTHIPLKDVPVRISAQDIFKTITTGNSYLKNYFGIKNPKIAVCGVNPHAGEEGIFGTEEKKFIKPAMTRARRNGIKCEGPVSADTVFYKALQGAYDMVVAMYHDQGAIPLKLHAFETGVNVTLGIPFIRTSPDHGTAYDIAGKGIADINSMKEAIKLAAIMSQCKKQKTYATE